MVVRCLFFALLLRCFVSSRGETLNLTSNESSDTQTDAESYGVLAPKINPVVKAILTIFDGVLLLGALLGNALVIHVVRTNKRMRTTTNILIVNMAISDLFIALIFIPSQTVQLYVGKRWFEGIFGSVTCKAVMSSRIVSVACSVFSLVAIAIDRYFAVVHPLKRRATSNKTKWIIGVIWFVSIAVCIPPMRSYKMLTLDLKGGAHAYCTAVGLISTANERLYIVIGFILTFIIPFLVMIILYTNVGRILRMRSHPGNSLETSKAHALKTSRHVTKMMVTVVISFAVCMLPIQTYLLIRFFRREEMSIDVQFWGMIVTFLLSNANAFINPCVYVVYNETFRCGFRRALFCRCGSQEREPYRTSCESSTWLRKVRLSPTIKPQPEVIPFERDTAGNKDRMLKINIPRDQFRSINSRPQEPVTLISIKQNP